MEGTCQTNIRIWNEITEGSSSSIKGTDFPSGTGAGIVTSKQDINKHPGGGQTVLSRLPLPENHSLKINTNRMHVVKDNDGKKSTNTIADITKQRSSDLTPYVWYAEMFRKHRETKTRKEVYKALAVVVVVMMLTLGVIVGIAVFIWNRDKIFT